MEWIGMGRDRTERSGPDLIGMEPTGIGRAGLEGLELERNGSGRDR